MMDFNAKAYEIAGIEHCHGWERLRGNIAAALKEAYEAGKRHPHEYAPAAYDREEAAQSCKGIIDCTGDAPVVRQMLGALPVTADGRVAGIGCTLWFEDANWMTMRRPQFYERQAAYPVNLSRAYGSKEAAEKAKAGEAPR